MNLYPMKLWVCIITSLLLALSVISAFRPSPVVNQKYSIVTDRLKFKCVYSPPTSQTISLSYLEKSRQLSHERRIYPCSTWTNHIVFNMLGQKAASTTSGNAIFQLQRLPLATSGSLNDHDPNVEHRSNTGNSASTLKNKVSSIGTSGLLAYGILNFLYYVTVTSITWFAMLSIKSSTGSLKPLSDLSLQARYATTLAKLGKVMAVVWAGSQVTKVPRLSLSIVMAPMIDRMLVKIEGKFPKTTRGEIFNFIVRLLLSSTFLFYAILISVNILTL